MYPICCIFLEGSFLLTIPKLNFNKTCIFHLPFGVTLTKATSKGDYSEKKQKEIRNKKPGSCAALCFTGTDSAFYFLDLSDSQVGLAQFYGLGFYDA